MRERMTTDVRGLEQYQIVAMNELRLVDVTEPSFDLVTGRAQDFARFQCVVVDETASDLAALAIQTAYNFAAIELTGHVVHADRQQTLAVLPQSAHCTGVQRDSPAHLQVIGKP